jgi:hypothetical protein
MNGELKKTPKNAAAILAPKKIRKAGSGRVKGSYSFARISLADLNKMFPNGEMPVMISRRWAEAVGIKVKSVKAVNPFATAI